MQRCLLIADEAEQVSYRWESFVAVLANKLGGVHRPEEIPVIVDEISCYRVGGVPVLRYALRNFGVLTSRYTHELLVRLGSALGPVHTDVPWIGAVRIRGDLDSKLDVQVLAEVRKGSPLVSWDETPNPAWLFDPPPLFAPPPDRSAIRGAGRNEACPCQSGKKYKHCCGR